MENEIYGSWTDKKEQIIKLIQDEATRELKQEVLKMEAQILSYRDKFSKLCDELSSDWGCYMADTYLEDFDKHFNIINDREGKI